MASSVNKMYGNNSRLWDTNDKIPIDVRHHLGADVVLADGEMDTSHRNAMFATRDFEERGDVSQSDVCW